MSKRSSVREKVNVSLTLRVTKPAAAALQAYLELESEPSTGQLEAYMQKRCLLDLKGLHEEGLRLADEATIDEARAEVATRTEAYEKAKLELAELEAASADALKAEASSPEGGDE